VEENEDLSKAPIEWLNPPIGSFDDFGSSMLVLYVSSTGDAWEEFMWAGMDVRGVGVAPARNDMSGFSMFFIAWMIVGAFVSVNLFVGAIVDNFTNIKKETEGSATMTPEQQQWADAMRATSSGKAQKAPRMPSWGPRKMAYMLIHMKAFDTFVMAIIALNVFGMALDYHRMSDDATIYWAYTNGMLFFTYFYYFECVLKLFALGCNYFADAWCRFDFFLVSISLLDQFFAELLLALLPIPPTMLRVLRVARVLRILRLLKNLKGLRDLVFTLVLAFPGLCNVGALLGLVQFMYAVLGMNVFTFVMHGDAIDENKNFESFGAACLLLFQCLTGDGWSEFMDDLLVDEERGCDPDAIPSDCGSPLAIPYFLSFMVIGVFVMLNLVVAVILENFTALGSVNPDLVSAGDIGDFKEAWGAYDPDADGKIPAKVLPQLVRALKPPLGIGGTAEGSTTGRAVKFCISLGITQSEGQVEFREVLDALLNSNYQKKDIDLAVGADSPPAVREALRSRKKALGSPDIFRCSVGGLQRGVPLTPRRREVARVFADDLMNTWVLRKRKQWDKDPKSHPSEKRKRAAAAAAAAAPTVSCSAASAASAAVPNGKGAAASKGATAKPTKASPKGPLPKPTSLPPPRPRQMDRVDA